MSSCERGEVIGRMFQCSPKEPELYALGLLSSRTAGVESFEQLYFVDGVKRSSLREAAKTTGLLQSSEELELIIEEMLGTQCSMAKACETFALILVWHDVGDARDAWAKSWRHMVGLDLRHGASEVAAHNAALRHVELTLDHFRLTAQSFLLQYMPDDEQPQEAPAGQKRHRELDQEVDFDTDAEYAQFLNMPPLTDEQQVIVDAVVACVNKD